MKLDFCSPYTLCCSFMIFKELKIKGETHSRLEGDAGGGSVRGVVSNLLV